MLINHKLQPFHFAIYGYTPCIGFILIQKVENLK